jgi:hypothetical protein
MTPDHALSVHKQEAPCTAVAFTMTKSGSCENHAANAAYIAAMNPSVALRLIALAKAVEHYFACFDATATDEFEPAEKRLRAAYKELTCPKT